MGDERMATARRQRRSAAAAGAGDNDALAIGFSTQISPETPTYYFNYAEIASLPHDFALLFARVPAKLPPDRFEEVRAAGRMVLDCELQVLISPTLIPGLIRALTVQRERYEQLWGPIPDLEVGDAGKA
jgi:hypothetical protein